MEAARPGSGSLALRIAIALLTAITAVIHFSILFPDVMFILNGLGYLALLAALYAPVPALEGHKPLIRWVFVGYTSLTFLIWLAVGERTPIAFVDKAVELALIVLLLVERSRTSPNE